MSESAAAATPKSTADARAGNRILAWVKRCGIELDICVNVLTGGLLGQTCSLRCAMAQKAEELKGRSGAGCFFCRILDVLVQRNHCALQFSDQPSPTITYVRAGIAFGLLFVVVGAVLHAAVQIVHRL